MQGYDEPVYSVEIQDSLIRRYDDTWFRGYRGMTKDEYKVARQIKTEIMQECERQAGWIENDL